MPLSLPKWVSRAGALAILAILIWMVGALAVWPVVDSYRTTDDQLRETAEHLARFESMSKSYPKLRAQMEKLSKQHAASGIYLAGTTDALAAAELQEDVNATIERSGGKLRSIQILPVAKDGDFRKVTVRVQMTAKLAAFSRILHSLESAKPFLFIDNLDVKNRRARRTVKEQNNDPELVIRFDLYGYLRPELS